MARHWFWMEILWYPEYEWRNNPAAKEVYIVALQEFFALIYLQFGLYPDVIWVPISSTIIHPPSLLRFLLDPLDDIIRGDFVCFYSGLKDKYISKLVWIVEVYVDIWWLIWMLNVELVLVDSIGKLTRGIMVLWSRVSGKVWICLRVIWDTNRCSTFEVCHKYISFVEGYYKYLCSWVDCRWFVVHWPNLLDSFHTFEFDYAQYSLMIFRDHINHVDSFGLFWFGYSRVLIAILVLSPIKDTLISAVLFIFDITYKNAKTGYLK